MAIVIADKMDSRAASLLIDMGFQLDSRPAAGEIDLASVLSEAQALLVRSATTVDTALLQLAPQLGQYLKTGERLHAINGAALDRL